MLDCVKALQCQVCEGILECFKKARSDVMAVMVSLGIVITEVVMQWYDSAESTCALVQSLECLLWLQHVSSLLICTLYELRNSGIYRSNKVSFIFFAVYSTSNRTYKQSASLTER